MLVRFSTTLLVTLIAASVGSAQTVLLQEAPLVDSCCRVKLTLDLRGKVTFQNQGKTETIEHSAAAEHAFVERILVAKGAVAEKSARHYEIAKATIAGQTRSLRPKHALMVAHRVKDQLITYSLEGPLFVEEMELTEHLDTLALPGLLPNKEVRVGETWSVPTAVIQALCGLDALDAQVKQDLTCELKAIQGDLAMVSIQGVVKGIHLGAQVAIHIDAKSKLIYHTKHRRIIDLEWRQSDQRQQGPATPNLSADVTIKLERSPVETPKELNDYALVPVPNGAAPAKLTNILYRDPQGKFEFQHSREWQFIGERNGQRILKLVTGRGDWIADAVVMPWKGQKLDVAGFQQMIESSPGWEQDSDSQVDDKLRHPKDQALVRVSATGKLEGSPAYRSCYYLVSAGGEQLVVTIVTHPNQVNSLEARDQALVESIELK